MPKVMGKKSCITSKKKVIEVIPLSTDSTTVISKVHEKNVDSIAWLVNISKHKNQKEGS